MTRPSRYRSTPRYAPRLGNAQLAAHLPELLAGKLRSMVSVKHQTISNVTAEAYAPSAGPVRPGKYLAMDLTPPESGHIGDSYAASASVAEVSASKTSGATRLHQECRLRVL